MGKTATSSIQSVLSFVYYLKVHILSFFITSSYAKSKFCATPVYVRTFVEQNFLFYFTSHTTLIIYLFMYVLLQTVSQGNKMYL